MNLILPQNESLTMSSYELWKQINEFRVSEGGNQIRHNDFLTRLIDECDDLGGYESFVPPKQGVAVAVYMLNEDQMLLVGMRESKIVRKKVLAWIKALSAPKAQAPELPQNYLEALEHLVTKEKQLIEQAPKVEFVNRFIESTGNKSFRQVAKILKANEREFRAFLFDSKVMYQLGGGWTAHANHIDAGRFYATAGEANGHAYTECKFTPKGIEYIAGKWIAHKELSS